MRSFGMAWRIHRLGKDDAARMAAINTMFAAAFDDDPHYTMAPPDSTYLARTLANPDVIALAALSGDDVIGGLVAYVLPKLEQARAEIYIYDLAVAESVRRQGIATALIAEVRRIATDVGAWVVYIQADHGDPPAETLYTRLGNREEVLHFDLMPLPRDHPA